MAHFDGLSHKNTWFGVDDLFLSKVGLGILGGRRPKVPEMGKRRVLHLMMNAC